MSRSKRSSLDTKHYLEILTSLVPWLRRHSDGGAAFAKALAGLERMISGLKRGRSRPLRATVIAMPAGRRLTGRRTVARRARLRRTA